MAPQWRGQASVRGSHEFIRMALLTCSLIGMVFTWSLTSAFAAPYLQDLGLTKASVSLVWLVMPINSIIIQPLIGSISDSSTSHFGRRRPFMVASATIAGIAILSLAWSREISGFLGGRKDQARDGNHQSATIALTIFSLYILDMAMAALQAADRGLIVDTLSETEQQDGAAWDARMGAVGHITAYFIGSLKLVNILPNWLGGDTHFKKMAFVCVVALWFSVGATVWAVSERVMVRGPRRTSVWQMLSSILHRFRHLPARIQTICWVQFWTYLGWFPFQLYSTTWVGETYFRYEYNDATDGNDDQDVLGKVQRLGSMALVLHALVTLITSWILPWLVQQDVPHSSGAYNRKSLPPHSNPFSTSLLESLRSFKPRLVTVWACSELLFCVVFIWAPYVRSLWLASTLIALAGISWQVTVWAPMSEMGKSITIEHTNAAADNEDDHHRQYEAIPPRDSYEDPAGVPTVYRPSSTELEQQSLTHVSSQSAGKLSGVYLGILQVYTSLPAFVGSVSTWLIFTIFEPRKDKDPRKPEKWLDLDDKGSSAISICIFAGAWCAGVAAFMAWRLRRTDISS